MKRRISGLAAQIGNTRVYWYFWRIQGLGFSWLPEIGHLTINFFLWTLLICFETEHRNDH